MIVLAVQRVEDFD